LRNGVLSRSAGEIVSAKVAMSPLDERSGGVSANAYFTSGASAVRGYPPPN
jgi:hypothetical protein